MSQCRQLSARLPFGYHRVTLPTHRLVTDRTVLCTLGSLNEFSTSNSQSNSYGYRARALTRRYRCERELWSRAKQTSVMSMQRNGVCLEEALKFLRAIRIRLSIIGSVQSPGLWLPGSLLALSERRYNLSGHRLAGTLGTLQRTSTDPRITLQVGRVSVDGTSCEPRQAART